MLMFDQFGRSMKDRLLRRSQPYRNERIINVIRNMYFTGGVSSFARCFNNMFVRFHDDQGAMIPVVPDAMVALVATAVSSFPSHALMSKFTCNLGVLCRV
jgi:hypothetical protein